MTRDYMTRDEIAALAVKLLGEVRARNPLVHNIANYVSMDVAANALLALGASPAMVHAPEEVEEFTGLCAALVVNIGTLSAPWVAAMLAAAKRAHALKKPWVLDPVGVGATGYRNATVKALLACKPSIIRGNASEIMAVAGLCGLAPGDAAPQGVDSAHSPDEALGPAVALARHLDCTIIATGAVDVITDGAATVRLGNGDALMTRVTALGCALSGVVGAFAAVTPSAFEAAVGAVACYGIAGEDAVRAALGPGSFRVHFLDSLAGLNANTIGSKLKVVA